MAFIVWVQLLVGLGEKENEKKKLAEKIGYKISLFNKRSTKLNNERQRKYYL